MYQIDVQDEINVQEGKFLKNIKCAGQNRRAGGKIFSKSINVQTKISAGGILFDKKFFSYIYMVEKDLLISQRYFKAFPKYPKVFQSLAKAITK